VIVNEDIELDDLDFGSEGGGLLALPGNSGRQGRRGESQAQSVTHGSLSGKPHNRHTSEVDRRATPLPLQPDRQRSAAPSTYAQLHRPSVTILLVSSSSHHEPE
jgi:hypothetical protein